MSAIQGIVGGSEVRLNSTSAHHLIARDLDSTISQGQLTFTCCQIIVLSVSSNGSTGENPDI